jgi:hypothetical protein
MYINEGGDNMRLIYLINDGEWKIVDYDTYHNFTGEKKYIPSTYFVTMTYNILLELRGS